MKDKNSQDKILKKILVIGSSGNFNFGDDLLIFSMIKCLKNHNNNLEMDVFSRSGYISRFVADAKLVGKSDKRDVYDLLLYAGGTQFATFRNSKNQLFINYLEQLVFLFKNPRKILDKIKKIRSKQSSTSYNNIALVGVGIGPFFEQDSYYHKTIELLKGSDFIAVRDVLSMEICRANGIKCGVGSDLIFSLPKNYWLPFKSDINKKKKIAIIIRDWDFSQEKASFIKQIAILGKRNENISIFSFCKPKDKKGIALLYKAGLGNRMHVWNPEVQKISDFLNLLSPFDLFVTSRYHGALVAALMGKPFISIGIEPKLTMVAEKFKVPIWKYPYSLDDFEKSVRIVNANYYTILQGFDEIIENERKINEDMMNGLYDLLDEV